MATRKAPRKTTAASSGLARKLRDAVELVDRALAALGDAPKKTRAGQRKRRRT